MKIRTLSTPSPSSPPPGVSGVTAQGQTHEAPRDAANLGLLAGLPKRPQSPGPERTSADTPRQTAGSTATHRDPQADDRAISIILDFPTTLERFKTLLEATGELPPSHQRRVLAELGSRVRNLPEADADSARTAFSLAAQRYTGPNAELIEKEAAALVDARLKKMALVMVKDGELDFGRVIRDVGISDQAMIESLEDQVTLEPSFRNGVRKLLEEGENVQTLADRLSIRGRENIARLASYAIGPGMPAPKDVLDGMNVQEVAAKYGILDRDNILKLEMLSIDSDGPATRDFKKGKLLPAILQDRGISSPEAIAALEKQIVNFALHFCEFEPEEIAEMYDIDPKRVAELS